ncbi:MAG: helix-turn-helix domain-containing protein [Planctomyces sp.]|jgi:transposase
MPWAGKHSRFTLLFEAFAIDVLQASQSIQSVALLLSIDWSNAQVIMQRAGGDSCPNDRRFCSIQRI